MTTLQENTIERITKKVQRLNGNQTVSVHNLRKGHVTLNIFNVRDLTDVVTTTTFVDVEINTKGNITKGFANEYTPKVEKVYPYMN
jgi:hypothetical protein